MNILAADDDAITRSILYRVITSEPRFALTLAKDGHEAWQQLVENGGRFDVCLLDISMPGMEAFDILARMRENTQLCRKPVILLTASNDAATVRKALAFPIKGFLVKPCSREKILEKLYQQETLLRSKGQLQPAGTRDEPIPSQSRPVALKPPAAAAAPAVPDLPPLPIPGAVCARMRITMEAYRLLVRLTVRDVIRWTVEAQQVSNRLELIQLDVRAKNLNKACESLGVDIRKSMAAARAVLNAAPGTNENGGHLPVVAPGGELIQNIYADLATVFDTLGPPAPDTGPQDNPSVVPVTTQQLQPGHVLVINATSRTGMTLVVAGNALTEGHIERLRAFADLNDLHEPLFLRAIEENPDGVHSQQS